MASIEAQGFNHVAIWVSDVRKSADWYIAHLGLEEASGSENRIFLRLANREVLALFQASDPAQIGAGVHHLAFNLPDGAEEKALDTLRQRNIPLTRRGPSLSFQDPDGHWIHFG
jgi:catechol 2,3-dioxygenase-like lactoylglutathione lyase family enzyme